MRCRVLIALALALLFSSTACAQTAATTSQPTSPTRYESSIAAFEAQDKKSPPPATPTVFIGSSTFTRWKALAAEFKEFTAINRAFGGSTLADVLYFTDRMVIAYQPKTVVLYAGTNDIARGASPEKVQHDFEQLAEKIHASLPNTQIHFISAIPSPSRVKVAGKMDELNALAQKYIAQHDFLHYVDARFALSDPEKQPDPKLYAIDHLHPNAEGYKRLIPLIRAALQTPPATAPAK